MKILPKALADITKAGPCPDPANKPLRPTAAGRDEADATAIDVASRGDTGYDRKRGVLTIPIFRGKKTEIRELT